MSLLWDVIKAFVVGGLICVVGQVLIDKTKMTSGRVLVLFVSLGVILGAAGLYEPLVDFAGSGATVPLPGFGYALAKGAMTSARERGLIGAFTGGLTAAAGGITAALLFAFLAALVFNPKSK